MGMSALLRLSAGALFAALALTGTARADTRTFSAKQLVLNDTLQEDTVITPDPGLTGQVRITREDGLDCLSVVESGALVIDTARCEGDQSLHIEVPPGMALVLTANGGGDIKIGDIGGPLTLDLTGSGDVTAGRTGPLILSLAGGSDVSLGSVFGPAVLTLSGGGDVKMTGVNGPLTVRSNGSGDLAIGSIDAPAVDVQGNGHGDILIGGGSIGSLGVRLNGAGDFATAASSREANLSAHGGGDMRVGPVAHIVHQDSGGGSEIHIGSSELVSAVIADVAHAIGTSENGEHHVAVSHSSDGGHILTLLVVAFMGFLIFRILLRVGGLPRKSQPPAAASPTHAGVVALCESLARTEQRLGRVEAYVTSREFDLQQKFREMGRS
jgi:hypothetical protein